MCTRSSVEVLLQLWRSLLSSNSCVNPFSYTLRLHFTSKKHHPDCLTNHHLTQLSFSQTSTMPSPFQQKYSSQSHKVFGDNPVPDMRAGPKETADRRSSDSSMNSASGSPDGRRRSSAAQRYANLHALKRPESEEHQARRASLQDSYGKVGVLGGLWNT
jgi:hypothetical protein